MHLCVLRAKVLMKGETDSVLDSCFLTVAKFVVAHKSKVFYQELSLIFQCNNNFHNTSILF